MKILPPLTRWRSLLRTAVVRMRVVPVGISVPVVDLREAGDSIRVQPIDAMVSHDRGETAGLSAS